MIRGLIKLILVVVVIVAAGAFFLGYRWAGDDEGLEMTRPVATSGSAPAIDTSRARETGAEIGEKVAVGATEARRGLAEAGLTAKIKSKMALDDTLDAARIDVDTEGTVVTLQGRVDSEAEKARALQLARETAGVTSVVDQLRID